MDIDATTADKVYSAGTGTVENIGRTFVTVKHLRSDGSVLYSYYEHLSSIEPGLRIGLPVTRNSPLGNAGDRGNSTPGYVHLHFEVSASNRFGSTSGYVPLKACVGDQLVVYPGSVGWEAMPRNTVFQHDGDTCFDPDSVPRNSIIQTDFGVSYVMDSAGVLHHIPFSADDACWRQKAGWPVGATLTYGQVVKFREAEPWPCVIGTAVVRAENGAIFLVGESNYRHWIQDMETVDEILRQGVPSLGTWPDAEVAKIPESHWWPKMLYRPNYTDTMICRVEDGVCWVTDGAANRFHVPSFGSNVCWRWSEGRQVRWVNAEQANSLPEYAPAWCDIGGKIIVANSGAVYFMVGEERYWIPDWATVECLHDQGHPIIWGVTQAEMDQFREPGHAPRCLSPFRVKNTIVRAYDGTAYLVDHLGWWHWIPDGGTWNCLTARYPVYIWEASWDQINTLRAEQHHASCGM